MLKDLTVLSEFSITSANAVIDTRVNIEHYAAKVVRKQSKQSRTSLNTQQGRNCFLCTLFLEYLKFE
jgi:hypothetical protein